MTYDGYDWADDLFDWGDDYGRPYHGHQPPSLLLLIGVGLAFVLTVALVAQ